MDNMDDSPDDSTTDSTLQFRSARSPTSPTSTTFPQLAQTLILVSTKAYFSTSRTESYLETLLDPSSGILPLLSDLSVVSPHSSLFKRSPPPKISLTLLPDLLSLQSCARILHQHTSPTFNPPGWPISLGAQNCSPSPDYGAFTGETPCAALKDIDCTFIELGHAERRAPPLCETDALIARKAACVEANGMVPLLCVGEKTPPPRLGPIEAAIKVAVAEIRVQLQGVLDAVHAEAPLVLAYEPVWAIGQEVSAPADYVGQVVLGIRTIVHVNGRSGAVKVVYGGSAGPGSWKGGLGGCVDGLFLGRFAHQVEDLRSVVEEVLASDEPE